MGWCKMTPKRSVDRMVYGIGFIHVYNCLYWFCTSKTVLFEPWIFLALTPLPWPRTFWRCRRRAISLTWDPWHKIESIPTIVGRSSMGISELTRKRLKNRNVGLGAARCLTSTMDLSKVQPCFQGWKLPGSALKLNGRPGDVKRQSKAHTISHNCISRG